MRKAKLPQNDSKGKEKKVQRARTRAKINDQAPESNLGHNHCGGPRILYFAESTTSLVWIPDTPQARTRAMI
jgi:hypothetical protein